MAGSIRTEPLACSLGEARAIPGDVRSAPSVPVRSIATSVPQDRLVGRPSAAVVRAVEEAAAAVPTRHEIGLAAQRGLQGQQGERFHRVEVGVFVAAARQEEAVVKPMGHDVVAQTRGQVEIRRVVRRPAQLQYGEQGHRIRLARLEVQLQALPYGLPRRTDRRIARSSASVCGALTCSVQSDGCGKGQSPSNGPPVLRAR